MDFRWKRTWSNFPVQTCNGGVSKTMSVILCRFTEFNLNSFIDQELLCSILFLVTVCVLHFPSSTVIAQTLEPFEIEYNSKRPTAWWFVFQTTRVILNEQQWKCLFCLLADGNASIQLACVCCQREKKGTVDIPQLPGHRWPANSGRPRRSYFSPVV